MKSEFLYPEMETRKQIGPDVWIEDSIKELEPSEKNCPVCGVKGSPKYIFFGMKTGAWFCGSDDCITFYLLKGGV